MFDDQSRYDARFEWGEAGVARLAPDANVVVIVDVLSFATAVDIAVGRGAVVFPYRWRDESAVAFAKHVDATLATIRRPAPGQSPYSLSPSTLLTIPPGYRLVLPSPNGATLTAMAGDLCPNVLVGCLRNANAIAQACHSLGESVAVIAAGERWTNSSALTGSLRPAIEDLIGAGAILRALNSRGPSPESTIAIAAFDHARSTLPAILESCGSGRELIQTGFETDVELAGQLDVSQSVPYLTGAKLTPFAIGSSDNLQ